MQQWNHGELARRGSLVARLASSESEINASQQLRHDVFFKERLSQQQGSDEDRFDKVCDHLLVIDTAIEAAGITLRDGALVGTYRLLRQEIAEQNFGLYTQNEFDIAKLIARKPQLRFLELGRSCVHRDYRTKNVVELLWQGIWNYVRHHRIDVMLGCASLEGTNPAQHAQALRFLARHAAAVSEWKVSAQPRHHVVMDDDPDAAIDQRRALASLPPLIKGYLRLGCSIGDGAVIDHAFNTIDVLIILPVASINPRYFEHFGQPNG